MKRFLQVSNILALVFALVANALVGARLLDLPAINEISDKYATLLTPATYAFSIWSLIYLLLTIFVIYQARDLFSPKANNTLPQRAGPYFIIASICNGLWTYIFVNEWLFASVIALTLLTISLYILVKHLSIGTGDAKRTEIMTVWWPIELYTGWVTVASIVNIASWLQSRGITISVIAACIIVIALAISLVLLIVKKNLRELTVASIWGITAIAVQQLNNDSNLPLVIVILASLAVVLGTAGYRAYQNRGNLFPN